MESKEKELKEVLTELTHKEKRARKRALLYTIIPFLLGGFLLLFSYKEAMQLNTKKSLAPTASEFPNHELERARAELEFANLVFEEQKMELTKEIETLQTTKNNLLNELDDITNKKLNEIKSYSTPIVNENVILEAVSGKKREAIELAFKLQKSDIRFEWGGKNPSTGFDSSGFISYIFSEINIIKNPEGYWSGRLREKFGCKDYNDEDELQIGDLLFYEAGVCMLYLGDNCCIGMFPEGISIKELYFGFGKTCFGRVDYSKSLTVE